MSFELRRVPKGWEHPRNEIGRFIPLFGDSYAKVSSEWDEEKEMWDKGFVLSVSLDPDIREFEAKGEDEEGLTYEEYNIERPAQEHYVPDWEPEERTHFQMYETVSEGTPFSPVMETLEDLASWLADNFISPFTGKKASYEQWFRVCENGGTAVTAVCNENGELISGVESY